MPFWGGICAFKHMTDAFTTINLPLILHTIPNLSNSSRRGTPTLATTLPLWSVPLHVLRCQRSCSIMFFSELGWWFFQPKWWQDQSVSGLHSNRTLWFVGKRKRVCWQKGHVDFLFFQDVSHFKKYTLVNSGIGFFFKSHMLHVWNVWLHWLNFL